LTGGTLYPGGGVALAYRDGAVLLRDMRGRFPGAALEVDAQGALRLESTGPVTLYPCRLPLARPLEVTADVVLHSGEPTVTVALGTGAKDLDGVGLAWGVAPARIRKGRLKTRKRLGVAPRPRQPYRITLAVVPADGGWKIRGELRELQGARAWSASEVEVKGPDLRGEVGLHLTGKGVVGVRRLELRGLLDPDALLGK
jgi:hypothetical protein